MPASEHQPVDDPRPEIPLSVIDYHDSPWKDALELYFPQALALLAPGLHAIIDWDVPVIFLDKELQAFGWRMLEYTVLICQRERRKRQSVLPPQVYSLGVLIDQPSESE